MGGARLVCHRFNDLNIEDLRTMADSVRSREKNIVMVFAAVLKNKVTFMISVSDDLTEKGVHAGRMIKEVAKAAGGGGGGKANMAMAGAKDPSKVDVAFAKAEEILCKNMEEFS